MKAFKHKRGRLEVSVVNVESYDIVDDVKSRLISFGVSERVASAEASGLIEYGLGCTVLSAGAIIIASDSRFLAAKFTINHELGFWHIALVGEDREGSIVKFFSNFEPGSEKQEIGQWEQWFLHLSCPLIGQFSTTPGGKV